MKIYHNNRCSKSRDALNLLQQKVVEFETVDYLKNPLTKIEIMELLKKLNIPANELVRKSEPDYKENFKGKERTEEQWIDAMAKNPKLIERPIVVKGDKAVIGRPLQNVINFLKNSVNLAK